MARPNANYAKLQAGYLFPEIGRRTREFQEKNPDAQLIRLGIGDTTRPLAPTVVAGLSDGVNRLGASDTYSGYGDGEGTPELREALVARYKTYGVELDADEVFVSDGAKSDSANIQSIFADDTVVAVQDPAYPVYVDSNVIGGKTGTGSNGQYDGLVYMPCTEENEFFPELPEADVDLIYLCSPNNPTGAVATIGQLKKFVDFARERKAVIIFDAAYASFITDARLPRSIYEVEGAKECAIEVNSFSKEAGFTGVRLGWTVVPKTLVCDGADEGLLNGLWNRRQNTMFNGASNIVQAGGVAVLSEQGQRECKEVIDYYMVNAKTILEGLESLGIECFGGVNAPYVWMKTPGGVSSWEFFDKLLTETYVVGTPGSGFGPKGEGFFRLSAFGSTEDVERAIESIKTKLKL